MAAAVISERMRHARSSTGLERAVEDEQGRIGVGSTWPWPWPDKGHSRGPGCAGSRAWPGVSSTLLRPETAAFDGRGATSANPTLRYAQLQQLDEQIGRLVVKSGRNQAEDQRLEELRQRKVRLRGRYVAFENELDERYRAFAGRPATLAEIRKPSRPYGARGLGRCSTAGAGPTLRRPRHWACIVRGTASPIWVKLNGSGTRWRPGRRTDEDRPATLRTTALIAENKPVSRVPGRDPGPVRLEPLRPHLEGSPAT